MHLKRFASLSFLPLLFAVLLSDATASDITVSSKPVPEERRDGYVRLLNELSERRRPRRLFEFGSAVKPSIGFVDSGGLTAQFGIRDVVVRSRIPIVIGRTYDSGNAAVGVLGPGWRFAPAQRITFADDRYRYRDESGELWFWSSSDAIAHTASGRSSHGYFSVTIEGRTIRLTFEASLSLEFTARNRSRYVLTRANDSNGNSLRYLWSRGRLEEIRSSDGRHVDLEYNSQGLLRRVEDDSRRVVRYRYTGGVLSSVLDMAEQRWRFFYTSDQRLQEILDPTSRSVLRLRYRNNGSVRSSVSGLGRFRFESLPDGTRVSSSAGVFDLQFNEFGLLQRKRSNLGSEAYRYNRLGHLEFFSSFEGLETVVTRDSDNRIREISQQGIEGGANRTVLEWSNDRIMGLYSNSGQNESYSYDLSGRLASVVTNDTERGYSYSDAGDLVEAVSGGETRTYGYNDHGQVSSITDAGSVVAAFVYDSVGQLRLVQTRSGKEYAYEYNASGLREKATFEDSVKRFSYDEAGSLTSDITSREDSEETGYVYELGERHELIAIRPLGQDTIEIDYDDLGNPISYGDTQYGYDDQGRLQSVTPQYFDTFSFEYLPNESDVRDQLDVVTGSAFAVTGSASIFFPVSQTELISRVDKTAGVPLQFVAKSLRAVPIGFGVGRSSPELPVIQFFKRIRFEALEFENDREALIEFNRASNALFIPPEYRSMNCTQNCNVYFITATVPSSVQVGQTFTASAVSFGDDFCIPTQEWYFDGGLFPDRITFGQIAATTYSFGSAGSKPGSVASNCPCTGLGAVASWTIIVELAQCNFTAMLNVNPLDPKYTISASPAMPTFIATASNKFPSNATIAWLGEIEYQSSVGDQFNSSTKAGAGDLFNPNWGSDFYGGEIRITGVCSAPGFLSRSLLLTADVEGQNPSEADVKAYAGSSPWFLSRMIRQESSFRQFESNGLPVIGTPRGYGLMQVDNVPQAATHQDAWNWQQNIDTGKAGLNGEKFNIADDWWDRQVTQHAQAVASGQTTEPPAPDKTVAGTTFSSSPSGSQRSHFDAIWIKSYNGNSRCSTQVPAARTDFWLAWINSASLPSSLWEWEFNESNSDCENYVQAVLQQVP